jgi:hypothetical protein
MEDALTSSNQEPQAEDSADELGAKFSPEAEKRDLPFFE